MLVKPAPNPSFDKEAKVSRSNPQSLLVFDPVLKDYLPAYGRDVGSDHGLYWHRLVLNGDVVEISADDLNKGIEAEVSRMKAAAAAEQDEAAKAADAPKPGITVQKPAPKAPVDSKKPAAAGAKVES